MLTGEARLPSSLFLSFFSLVIIFTLLTFSFPGRAEQNSYGCSCNTSLVGTQGSCKSGQICAKPNAEITGLYCHLTAQGGFPLGQCGEACQCGSDKDCAKISFAGRCIKNHCYSMVNGIFVAPMACPQHKAETD